MFRKSHNLSNVIPLRESPPMPPLGYLPPEQTSVLEVNRIVLTIGKKINPIQLWCQTRKTPGLPRSYIGPIIVRFGLLRQKSPLTVLGLVAPNTNTAPQVSVSGPCYRGRCSRGFLCLSPSEENTDDTREGENGPAVALRSTLRYQCFVRSVNNCPVLERGRRDMALGSAPISVGVAKTAAVGFGPLKTFLGDIYADHKVRLRPPAQNSPLTNPSTGNRRHRKQDRKLPLTYSRTRRAFCITPNWCGRSEAP